MAKIYGHCYANYYKNINILLQFKQIFKMNYKMIIFYHTSTESLIFNAG